MICVFKKSLNGNFGKEKEANQVYDGGETWEPSSRSVPETDSLNGVGRGIEIGNVIEIGIASRGGRRGRGGLHPTSFSPLACVPLPPFVFSRPCPLPSAILRALSTVLDDVFHARQLAPQPAGQ